MTDTQTKEEFTEWMNNQKKIQLATYSNAARQVEMIVNATNGKGSLDALDMAGKENLAGKVLLDIANPLDFSNGMPPSLTVCNTSSLAEQIQQAFPDTKVVKSLNTLTAPLMVNPSLIPGDHSVFMNGNDAEAKDIVRALLNEFGWQDRNIIDLGDITSARGTEMILPIWVRLYGTLQTPMFNFNIVMVDKK